MTPELKSKWVAALRSGKYKQTQTVLRDDLGFCCLGVLCDVIGPTGWSPVGGGFTYLDTFSLGLLGTPLLNYVGLDADTQVELTKLNDEAKLDMGSPSTFAEIADYIEANV